MKFTEPKTLQFTYMKKPVQVKIYHENGQALVAIDGLDLSQPLSIERLSSLSEWFTDLSMEAEMYE